MTSKKPSPKKPKAAKTPSMAGNPSYKGYAYQKLATAWVALTLLFEDTQGPAEIVVEPASSEDIEAKLDVDPSHAEARLRVRQKTLLTLQIKFRGSGHWSAEAFASLVRDKVKKGSGGRDPRPRAKALLLADPTRRYILFTNTSVDQSLAAGRVQRVDQEIPPDFLPPSVASRDAEKNLLKGRFGFIEGQSHATIRAELRRILEEVGNVSSGNVERAIRAIEREVEDRLLGHSAPITRKHVAVIVESAGGLPVRNTELVSYCPPPAAAKPQALLKSRFAVLLDGPPGLGKSLTAEHLAYEHRKSNPPFTIVHDKDDLAAIETLLSSPGRHLFYLDDPWGQSKLDSDAGDWTIKLPRLLRSANSDKLFVITSRTDILKLARVGANEPPWRDIRCTISPSDYDEEARWAILIKKLQGAPSWQHDLVVQHRSRLEHDLTTPLAIDRFTRGLRECSTPAVANIDALINDAQLESIRRIVAEQIRGWGPSGVTCAAIVWALLRRSEALHPSRIKALRRQLAESATPIHTELEQFVQHLQPASLSIDKTGNLNAHGKVIEALEYEATQYPGDMERTLNACTLAALALVETDPSYIVELLRLIDAVASIRNQGVALSSAVRGECDKLLISRAKQATEKHFSSAWRDMTNRVSEGHLLGRLTRYLELGTPRKVGDKTFSDIGWQAPTLSASELDAIRESPNAAWLLKEWVASILLRSHKMYRAVDLLPWLKQFGLDLAPAFLRASRTAAQESHYLTNANVVVEGAVWDNADNDAEVLTLILELERSIDARQKARSAESTGAWQGELDMIEQIHLQDDLEEEGSTVGHMVEGYVHGRRRRDGYTWIPSHTRLDLLLPAWTHAMTHALPKVTLSELDCYLSVANTAAARASGLRVVGERKLEEGKPRLLEALVQGPTAVREAAVRSLKWLSSQSDVEASVTAVLPQVDLSGQIELLLAVGELGTHRKDKSRSMRRVAAGAPADSREVLEVVALGYRDFEEDLDATFKKVSPAALEQVLKSGPPSVARLFLSLAIREGIDVGRALERFLESENVEDLKAGIATLGYIGTSAAYDRIALLLSHTDYDVRRAALNALAHSTAKDHRKQCLGLVTDRSAPVRERLAAIIAERKWTDGLSTLRALLRDRRNYNGHPEQERWPETDYRVARTAASSLSTFQPWSPDLLDAILAFVGNGEEGSDDVLLHSALVEQLSQYNDSRITTLLCGLLSDQRVLGSADEMVFPVRYTSAWTLLWQTIRYPERYSDVDWALVEAAAAHVDAQLAAPTLCLLGTQMGNPRPEALAVLRSDQTSEARRLLALMASDSFALARKAADTYGILPLNHPMLTAAAQDTDWPTDASAWAWLKSLSFTTDVEGVLKAVAAHVTKLDLELGDFAITSLRRKSSIPVMTLSEMFGME